MLLIWAAIEITREIIYADSTLEESRFRPEYFTRNRLMPFYKLLRFLLSMYKTSSQTALNQFFEKEEVTMSQQALSKARNKFDHSPFVKLYCELPAKLSLECIKCQFKGVKEILSER